MKKFLLSIATSALCFTAFAVDAPEGTISVAEALQLIEEGYTGEATVEGIISNIQEVSVQYGNATYTIKDDLEDEAGLVIYRGKYLEGESFTSTDQIAVGGSVVVVGSLINYNETTPEMQNGSLVSYTAPENDDNTPDAPEGTITVEEALELISQGYRGEATVKGYVAEITDFSLDYGNATYILVDEEGDENGITVFRGKYFNGESFTSEDQLEVGALVEVKGTLTLYNETPEINTGSVIISYNGETGETDTPETPDAPEGTITVAEAVSYIDAGYEGKATVKGIISEIAGYDERYGSITYNIVDELGSATYLKVYSGLGLNGDKFESADDLEVGAIVVVEGNLMDYNGTPEFNYNSVILEYTSPSGDGVEGIIVDINAPVQYYNLQGVRVNNPAKGNIYILRQGNKTAKVIIR